MHTLEAIGASLLAQVGQELTRQLVTNPGPLLDGLDAIFCPGHTGYDACADILDAVKGGHLSHQAALQAIAVLMADMERRGQKPAAPQPQGQPQPAKIATAPAVEFDVFAAIADFVR